jgi:hypothetical protein
MLVDALLEPVNVADAPTFTVCVKGKTVGAVGDEITVIAPETVEVVLGQDAELMMQ